MADDLGPDEELIVAGLLERLTARELAEELVRRCGCTFDHRLPDDAPPVLECDYHRGLREADQVARAAGAADDVCEVCGKWLGYGIRLFHLKRCEAHR